MLKQNALRHKTEPCQNAKPHRNVRQRTLEFFFFDAGGGHRAAVNALIASIETAYPGWDVEPVNLQELLQPADPVYQITRVKTENIYNAALKRGWTRGSKPFLRTLQKAIRLNSIPIQRMLRQHWETSDPDMVVSLIPNFNRLLFQALKSVHPDTPYVTIMTDIADSPAHFWMEDQDQTIICGSRKAALQAHLSGFYRPENILETSGMIVRPSFYRQSDPSPLTRKDLGLDPHKPTALIMFGGNGSKTSAKIADELRAADVQSIVMCGHNRKLLASLQNQPGCCPVGFTEQVADYMRLADFFVGKPGPGSMSEALLMGLPVIVENNAKTLIQERYNCLWAEEQGFGICLPDFDDIGCAARYLLSKNRLQEFRRNAARVNNRAVFEIPAMLDAIISGRPERLQLDLDITATHQVDPEFLKQPLKWTKAHLPYFKRPAAQSQSTGMHHE